MFVRAERRVLKSSSRFRDPESITFTVVRSERIDGKIKQRRLLYLGSFNSGLVEKWNSGQTSPHRIWGVISQKLLASEIPETQHKNILNNLTRWLKPLTKYDIVMSIRDQIEVMGGDLNAMIDKQRQEPIWQVAEMLADAIQQSHGRGH